MTPRSSRPGYVLLLSILIVGTISSAVVGTLLLLGTGAQRTAFALEQSSRAIALSVGCAEYALQALRADPHYPGGDILADFSVPGACEIFPVGGAGNYDRIICTEAQVGTVIRRLEIIVETLLPSTEIYSWQEVPFISLCGW